MNSDDYFQFAVMVALPAAVAYPLIYGTRTKWWRSWVGRALLIKAAGLGILLGFTAAFQIFGPDYPGRDWVRNVGITLVLVGVWTALLAMLHEFRRGRHS